VSHKDGSRLVEMAGSECPCGGTHVKDISHIGRILINKVKKKKGNIKVSYTLETFEST